ncbi:MAG: hypothetical protein DRJ49_04485 [Thermoprotei archaeon]|nr:MAG: hypothetical protein DRN53_06735 [Thermoprotei archaeon]RLE88813.1 MAG: hypothetical protein DRJ49_04485 [Thermoprotei archaeon]
MSQIELVAIDLDGTMLEPNGTILPELRDALLQLDKRGIKITTASGRELEVQLRFLKRGGLGAEIGIPHALIANEQEIYILYINRYFPLVEHNSRIDRAWLNVLPIAMDLLRETLKELREIGFRVELWIDEDRAIQKHIAGLIFKEEEEAREAIHYLKRKIEEKKLNFKCNRLWRLVQVLLPFAGKGETLKVLAEYWGIEYSRVLCIGDGPHDIEMLDGRYGFIPATVSNADKEVIEAVKRAGGYISPLPHGRGVLDILRKFGLIR